MFTFPLCHFSSVAVSPATIEFADVVVNGVTTTSLNDTIAINAAPTGSETRHVIVSFFGGANTLFATVTACTIGGVTATKLVEDSVGAPFGMGAVWIAEVPTGTTAVVTASWSASQTYSGGVAYVARNLQSATPIQALENTVNLATVNTISGINEPANGFVMSTSGEWSNVATTCAWTGTVGVVEDVDANVSGSNDLRVSGAHKDCSADTTGKTSISTYTVAPISNSGHRQFVLTMR